MIRSALAAAWPDSGLLGGRIQTVSLRAILDRGGFGADGHDNPATVAIFQLEWFVPDPTSAAGNGDARGSFTSFFPDPVSLGCVVLDEDFRWSLIDAWALVAKDFKGRGWVRWRIRGLGYEAHLGGGSLGRGVCRGTARAAQRSRFDSGIALSAGLADPNQNRGNPEWSARRDPGGDGQLHQVHGIPNKLKAARKAHIDLVVLSPADQKQCRDSDLTIVPASTVDEALKILLRRSLWRKLRGNPLAAILAVVICLLLGVMAAAMALGHLSILRRNGAIERRMPGLLKRASQGAPAGPDGRSLGTYRRGQRAVGRRQRIGAEKVQKSACRSGDARTDRIHSVDRG